MSINLVFGRKFAKNLDLGRNLKEISVLVESFENLDFGRNLRKTHFEISIMVEIF